MRPAVLVIDMIHDFVHGKYGSERARSIIPAIRELLNLARERGWPVIYLCDAHIPDDYEFRKWGAHALRGTKGSEVVEELAPQEGDVVVQKMRFDGFYETGLDTILRAKGVDTVILAGISTDICVQQTAVGAYYRGYGIIVPEECVQGITEEGHRRGLEYMRDILGAVVVPLAEVRKI